MAYEVRPWLFYGGSEAAELVASGGIKGMATGHHRIAVLRLGGATPAYGERVTLLDAEVRDEPEEDILRIIPRCQEFVRDAVKDEVGTVALIHCQAGISRSAAITAAVLMGEEGLSRDEALVELSETADPNEGFREQLLYLEKMGGRVDTTSKVYRAYRQGMLARNVHVGGCMVAASLNALDLGDVEEGGGREGGVSSSSPSLTSIDCDGAEEIVRDSALYRCRKCRRLVASTSNQVEHARGESGGGARRRNDFHRKNERGGDEKCHIFIEALKWMQSELEEGKIEGKLLCTKCNSRIGKYNWTGTLCSCGVWVTPSFQLHSNKIDVEPLV